MFGNTAQEKRGRTVSTGVEDIPRAMYDNGNVLGMPLFAIAVGAAAGRRKEPFRHEAHRIEEKIEAAIGEKVLGSAYAGRVRGRARYVVSTVTPFFDYRDYLVDVRANHSKVLTVRRLEPEDSIY